MKVSILYRRTREDMPADKVEIQDALEEGVEIRTLLNPVELIGEGGKLKSIRIMKQSLGQYDSSGRRKAVSSGESFVEDFDVVIPAISQTPDTKFAQGKMRLSGDRIVAGRQGRAVQGLRAGDHRLPHRRRHHPPQPVPHPAAGRRGGCGQLPRTESGHA